MANRCYCLILIHLVILVGVFTSIASCQDTEDDAAWSLPKYNRGCNSLMSGLHEEWAKADGEKTFEVGIRMFWALLLDPNAFYTEFATDSTLYERFTSNIHTLVFWNANDTTTSQLERLRVVAIERLTEESYWIDSTNQKRHDDLIALLRKVVVTHVD